MSTPLGPFPFPLGDRLDYTVGIAIRQAGNLSSGATLTIDLEGGPLELRPAGQAFHLVAPGQADRALPADDLTAFVWAAVLEHVRARATAAAGHRKGADSVKAA